MHSSFIYDYKNIYKYNHEKKYNLLIKYNIIEWFLKYLHNYLIKKNYLKKNY
jgi:hypothetical protein